MKSLSQKNMLILSPILPLWSDMDGIKPIFDVFKSSYQLTFLDSLTHIHHDTPTSEFFERWQEYLASNSTHYDVILGLSFGALILQKSLKIFEHSKTKLMLVSSPSQLDDDLIEKLSLVQHYAKTREIQEAVNLLNLFACYPSAPPELPLTLYGSTDAAQRVIAGIELVLTHDVVKTTNINKRYLNIVGENSKLVKASNTINSPKSETIIVQNAGMRVFQDNPIFCFETILKEISNDQ
jgi:hypothetical protein